MLGRAGLLLSMLIAAPALAEPLAFGAINGVDDLSRNADIGQCAADSAPCALRRTSFGGLPVTTAAMTLNPSGRVRSVEIVLNGEDFEPARELLAGRYGRPSGAPGGARWTAFDDGAEIAIRRAGANAVVSFDFPANAVAAPGAGAVQPWSLLLLLGLGLAAGFGGYRVYQRVKPAPPAPAPQPNATLSMRETLERRLRSGDGLSF